jgi:glycerophosphoryl diester phosphodiesterase
MPETLNTPGFYGVTPSRDAAPDGHDPEVQQRLPSLLSPPIGFAHRGARAHARENTLEAFELALRLGATGIESDVWLSADGVPVLDHDGVVRHGLRRRPIGTVNRDDLPGHVPSLADLLATIGASSHLSLDLKDDRSGVATIEAVRSIAPEMLERLWLCHPDPDLLVSLRRVDPIVRLVVSTRLAKVRGGPERLASVMSETDLDAVNLHHQEWSGGLTTLFHRFGRLAFAWDLQHEPLLRNVLRMGIDGVFSDHVDRMVDAFRAEGLG